MKQSTIEWLNAASDDLKAINRLLPDESLTNIIAFHCQQAIEKSLKAIVEEFNYGHIKTHNLQTLIFRVVEILDLAYDEDIIAEIDRLYIDSRYPSNLGIMPWGKPSINETNNYFLQARNIKNQVEEYLKNHRQM